MNYIVSTLEELDDVAPKLLAEAADRRVWLLFGEMGAGKTTLVRALGRALNVVSTVQSPTFGIINEYTTEAGEPVYHFDCYRLRNDAEAFDLGVEEYFTSGAYCFVEWPERIEALWPAQYFNVTLTPDAADVRAIHTDLT